MNFGEVLHILISTRRRAAAGLCVFSYFATMHLWLVFKRRPAQSFWFFPAQPVYPDWLVSAFNLTFLGYWIGMACFLVIICRHSRGWERAFYASFFTSATMSPIKSLASVPTAIVLEAIQAALVLIGVVAAVCIFRRLPSASEVQP